MDEVFSARLRTLGDQGLRRALGAMEPAGPGVVQAGGGTLINLSSNDYLGLARHPALAARAAEWGARYGTGAGASRLVCGTFEAHARVEARIASLKGTEAALLFASGWQANASVLPALLRAAGLDPLVFADRLNHASLIHGCQAAGARILRFRHNDLSHLSELLAANADRPARRFIVTESVFSMDGDRADVPALAALAARHDAFLYLDEAHATGMLGARGMGLSGDVPGGVDLVMGTFSKALGGFGAYVAGSRALCDFLVQECSGFIHTTALPPTVLGAIDAALDLVPAMDAARARVLASAARVRAGLAAAGISTGASTTQIVPAILGENRDALAASAALRAAGMLAVAIRPPTVPRGTARLRLAVCAAHEPAMLDQMVSVLAHALARRAA